MDIELKRALAPDEIDQEVRCGICEVPFVTEVVSAHVLVHDVPVVCLSCVEYLGGRNPERFPTLEEYREANERYPESVYASVEEIARLEERDDPTIHEAYQASWLSRT